MKNCYCIGYSSKVLKHVNQVGIKLLEHIELKDFTIYAQGMTKTYIWDHGFSNTIVSGITFYDNKRLIPDDNIHMIVKFKDEELYLLAKTTNLFGIDV